MEASSLSGPANSSNMTKMVLQAGTLHIGSKVNDDDTMLTSIPARWTPQFEYRPFSNQSELRLVILEPGSESSPISCRLIHASLNNCQKYEALSYTWGDPTIKQHIFLNGESFLITTNLQNALLNLRDEDVERPMERTLWVDAICINQIDILERNEQVPRIKSIYSGAAKVIIWLGNYHEVLDSQLEFDNELWGFSILSQGTEEGIFRVFGLLRTLSRFVSEHRVGEPWRSVDDSEISATKQDWANFRRLVRRPWFERLWVVQELFVAQEAQVLCGRCAIHWREFAQASEIIGSNSSSLPWSSNLKMILTTIEYWRPLGHVLIRRTQNRTLLGMLHKLQHLKCSDSRDRVYALLGICNDGQYINVDYTKSIQDVYSDWAWTQISRTRRLEVFSACCGSHPLPLPSWAPDLERGLENSRLDIFMFSSTVYFDLGSLYDFGGKLMYSSSGRSQCNARISADRAVLSVSGVNIDFVTNIISQEDATEACEEDPELVSLSNLDNDEARHRFTCLLMIKKLEIEVAKHFGIQNLCYGSQLWIEFVDVLFRGLKSWAPSEDGPVEDLRDRYATWRGFKPIEPYYKPEMDETFRLKAYMKPLDSILLALLIDIQLFVTKNGRLGLVKSFSNIQVNDKIYVFFGGNTPYILRSQSEKHRLIAPCYLHAFMDGEVIAGWRTGRYKSEEVTLV